MAFWRSALAIGLVVIAAIILNQLNSVGERSVVLQVIKYFCRPHAMIPTNDVNTPANWVGPNMMKRVSDWRYDLSAFEIDEIRRSVSVAVALNKTLNQYVAADLQLPSLKSNIIHWKRNLDAKYGLGVVIIRGVPVREWSEQESKVFWWCFGQHMGVPGAQNGKGDLLGHVRNEMASPDPIAGSLQTPVSGAESNGIGKIRQYRTNEFIPFHCDVADVVGLFCLSAAGVQGGASRLTSSVRVFNELRARRPDLVPLLFESTPLDTRGDGGLNWFTVIPSRYYNSVLRTFWHTQYFLTVFKHKSAPKGPSEKLLDLVRVYDEIANDPQVYLETEFLEGDIQLISNHIVS